MIYLVSHQAKCYAKLKNCYFKLALHSTYTHKIILPKRFPMMQKFLNKIVPWVTGKS